MFQDFWALWYRIWPLCFGIYSRRREWKGCVLVEWITMLVFPCYLSSFSHLWPLLWRAQSYGLQAGKKPCLRLVPILCGNFTIFYLFKLLWKCNFRFRVLIFIGGWLLRVCFTICTTKYLTCPWIRFHP